MAKRADPDLEDYRKKRDPAGTVEPFDPEPSIRAGTTRQGSFVVHLHDARRRHYDLRIETGGVLLSFAVPKGPSLDPKEKRLAVQTEAHPIGYLEFEEVIPAGNYGAGAMIMWDRGRIHYLEAPVEEGVVAGKIDFLLDGFKLKGRYALVRTSPRGTEKPKPGEQPTWLLLKKVDAFSRPGSDVIGEHPRSVLSGVTVDELADGIALEASVLANAEELGAIERSVDGRRLHPMLCAAEGPGLDAPGYYYELKLDGVRIVADKRGDEVHLVYRTGRPAATAYPEIARAVRALPFERVVLDGEIVAFDESGRPSFQRLGRRIQALRPSDVQTTATSVPVQYLVFDLLALGKWDLRSMPLSERKTLLAEVVRGNGWLRRLDHLEGDGRALFSFCEANGLEGVVAKRASSPYREGPRRTDDWVKVKCEREADFVVVGYTKGESSRARLGALDLATYDDDDVLVVRGKVGSGLDDATIELLAPRLEAAAVKEPQAKGTYGNEKGGRVHVVPELVVSVRFLGWSDEGVLRFPVFRGVREDIALEACRASPRIADDAAEALVAEAEEERRDSRVAGAHRVALTNQSKIFWPDDGLTKGDLCDYYDAISDTLLPYLRDRPVVLVRYPDGIRGKSFYQWRVPRATPAWVRSYLMKTYDEDSPRGPRADKATFIVEDRDTLLYIANLGCIPIHVIASRTASMDACDFLTIDFDLGGAELRSGVLLARTLHDVLHDIGLVGFPKTSGQTGLHVLVPLGPGVGWETAKMLNEVLGRIVVARHRDIATMERVKEKRGARVYVDVGQTGASRTIVGPYSVRAYPGGSVSTPLTWDEVGFALDPRAYTMATVPERVLRQGDPMRALLEARPDVASVVAKIGEMLPRGSRPPE